MISVTSYGGVPLVHSHNNSYALPSVTGAVQWNGSTKSLEVSTGGNWQKLDAMLALETTPEVSNILKWAANKMREEMEFDNLVRDTSDPTIKDLLDTIGEHKKEIQSAYDKIRIVKILRDERNAMNPTA